MSTPADFKTSVFSKDGAKALTSSLKSVKSNYFYEERKINSSKDNGIARIYLTNSELEVPEDNKEVFSKEIFCQFNLEENLNSGFCAG